MVMALGALGIVHRMTLDTVGPFDVRQVRVRRNRAREAVARATSDETLESDYRVSLFNRLGAGRHQKDWLSAGADAGGRLGTPEQAAGMGGKAWGRRAAQIQ